MLFRSNSILFKGIKDAKTGKILRNDSYDSGYFDGVKLGGVRIDINAICTQGVGSCEKNAASVSASIILAIIIAIPTPPTAMPTLSV